MTEKSSNISNKSRIKSRVIQKKIKVKAFDSSYFCGKDHFEDDDDDDDDELLLWYG